MQTSSTEQAVGPFRRALLRTADGRRPRTLPRATAPPRFREGRITPVVLDIGTVHSNNARRNEKSACCSDCRAHHDRCRPGGPVAAGLHRTLDFTHGGYFSRSPAWSGSVAHRVWCRAISQAGHGQVTLVYVPAVRPDTRAAVDEPVSNHPDGRSDRDHYRTHRLPHDLHRRRGRTRRTFSTIRSGWAIRSAAGKVTRSSSTRSE